MLAARVEVSHEDINLFGIIVHSLAMAAADRSTNASIDSGELMITLRRANERHHDQRRKQDVWFTFYPQDQQSALAGGFGNLELLNEDRLPPAAAVLRPPPHDAEIITYVYEGSLAYEDSMGRSGVVQAGEFQRMTAGRGVRHRESNASRSDWAHVFQVWLRPAEVGLPPSHAQKRFSTAERRGVLCVIASHDGRRGSLRVHQDVQVYSAILEPGQHIVHELLPGRSAWLHIVRGEVTLGDIVLEVGDGAGITEERAVSLTAREETEILLVDLAQQPPKA